MGFKIVDGGGRQTGRGASTVSELAFYGKTAQFRLSPIAVEALGSPERIEVLYDSDAGQIGLRASDASHAVTLRKDSAEGKSRYFGFKSFAAMIGLIGDDLRLNLPLVADGDMLVATLPAPTAAG